MRQTIKTMMGVQAGIVIYRISITMETAVIKSNRVENLVIRVCRNLAEFSSKSQFTR